MPNLQPLKRSPGQRHLAAVDLFGVHFAGDVRLDHHVVLVNELAEVVPDTVQHISRDGLGHLLHPLDFLVVLLLLLGRRVGDLVELFFQIPQNPADLTARLLDFFVKRDPLLGHADGRCRCLVRSGNGDGIDHIRSHAAFA